MAKRIDPDPISIGLAIMGLLGTYMGVGMAVQSKLSQRRRGNEAFEDQLNDLLRDVRDGLRRIQDEWEDIYTLIENVSDESGNGYIDSEFKAGHALLLTEREMKKYVRFKTKIDQSISQTTGRLNSLMNVVVTGNPANANVFLEDIEHIERCLNSILLEGCDWRSFSDRIVECIERVNATLRNFRNR